MLQGLEANQMSFEYRPLFPWERAGASADQRGSVWGVHRDKPAGANYSAGFCDRGNWPHVCAVCHLAAWHSLSTCKDLPSWQTTSSLIGLKQCLSSLWETLSLSLQMFGHKKSTCSLKLLENWGLTAGNHQSHQQRVQASSAYFWRWTQLFGLRAALRCFQSIGQLLLLFKSLSKLMQWRKSGHFH